MNSFTQKVLRVSFTMARSNAKFPGTNSNKLTVTGLRASAHIQAVARLQTQLALEVWGMRQEDMNALTVAWANPPFIFDNAVVVEANKTGRADGWVQVFKGTMIEAQPNYTDMPNVSFRCLATCGYFQKINAAAPTSFTGETDIHAIASDIVNAMGKPWSLTVAPGVSGVLSSPYLWGTLWDQLASACAAAHCDFFVNGDEILITEADKPRNSKAAVVLTKTTGLVGYPMFERSGLNVSALFDPAFLCGTAIEIKDGGVPGANGRWYPYSLIHDLNANMPDGGWFSHMQCLRVSL